jgi:tetraacyldisaccharide 4'-kinase
LISAIFASIARGRRRWYARRPHARRRLARPVVSVGNLAMGGSGKTPAVAHLARLLLSWGERPAILSRGYARRHAADGVVVVREPDRVVGGLDESGDEPLMLARALDGAAVLVSPDRYLAGALAERCFGSTVHLLDDGFQHVTLARDVDLLLVGSADLRDGRTLPAGRLREPLDAIPAADAIVLSGDDATDTSRVSALGARRVYRLARRGADASFLDSGQAATPEIVGPVAVVAGIARPERVAEDARAAGWTIVDDIVFPDHHAYSAADIDAIGRRARAAGASAVLTTAKDAVRLAPHAPLGLPVAILALDVSIEPAAEFQGWLRERLAEARR